MTTHPSPDDIRRATFRVVFRGFDQGEVEARLEELAVAVGELMEERDRMAARLGDLADRDLRSEFEAVGREVTSVLEAARTAAETMRERAGADAARWRSEAMAEAEELLTTARSDAEAMRTDAWTTGSQLLEQVAAEIERIRSAAERDSLAARGEAEREAHRLTAASRREADDVVRNAKMESERLVTQARSEHEEIIATAHRQAEAAQERTRALDQRRQELMAELEQVRTALSSFEGELEERRQGIGLSEPVDLPRRAVVADEQGTRVEDWEEGHTVRVIRPERHADDAGDTDAETLADEVARLRAEEVAEAEDEVREVDEADDEGDDEEPSQDESAEEITGEAPAPGPTTHEEPPPGDDNDVSDLFRRLRQPPPPEVRDVAGVRPSPGSTEDEETPAGESPPSPPSEEGVDPFETRERLLLPVTNDALRAVKRTLTDAQSHALEQLRLTNGAWQPDAQGLESALAAELEGLIGGAAQAGLEAAAEMGVTVTEPFRPDVETASIGTDLTRAVVAGLEASGADARERSTAVSRVFRGWRTDQAERRVRFIALTSYHEALSWALKSQGRAWSWIPAGRLCSMCRTAADSGEAVPPAHRDCNCTIVPA